MGHLKQTIVMGVVGCAALALWAVPASAADTPAPGAPATESQTPAPPPADPQAPAQPEDVQPEAPAADAQPAPEAPTAEAPAPPEAPASPELSTAAAAPNAPASNPTSTSSETVHEVSSGTASVQTAAPATGGQKGSGVAGVDALSGNDTVEQTLTQTSDSAGAAANGPVANLGAAAESGDQLAGGLGNRDVLRDESSSPSSSGAIPATMKNLVSILDDGLVSGAILPATGSTTGGSNAAPATTGSAPGLPGLPAPLQIPVLGSAGGSSTSSSGFFFFGFAGLLVGLLAAFAPALGRRLQGPPAGWRPAPYLSLLELPG